MTTSVPAVKARRGCHFEYFMAMPNTPLHVPKFTLKDARREGKSRSKFHEVLLTFG